MKICIVKLSSVGDILQAMKVVKLLSNDNRVTTISWVVEEKYLSLFQEVDWIDEIITIDTYFLRKNIFSKKFWSEIKRIKKFQFDYLFDLQGNLKSFFPTLLIKSNEKIGFGFHSIPEKIALLPLTIKKEIDLSKNIHQQYQDIIETKFPGLKVNSKENKLNNKNGYFLTIGSNWINKKLKISDWVKIIEFIWNKTGQECFLPYYFEQEEIEVDEIIKLCPKIAKKFPKSSFSQLKKSFSDSFGVIGVDSALVHLSALDGIKTFTIFGPSSSFVYAPNILYSFQGICSEGVEFKKRCPYLRTCKHGNCLKELPLEVLLDKLDFFLSLEKICN